MIVRGGRNYYYLMGYLTNQRAAKIKKVIVEKLFPSDHIKVLDSFLIELIINAFSKCSIYYGLHIVKYTYGY